MTDEKLIRALDQIVLELKTLNSTLLNILDVLQRTERQGKANGSERSRKQGRKLTKDELEKEIREKDKRIWKLIEEIKEMPSGDLLIQFDYLKSDEYEKVRDFLKTNFNAYYSKKYRGFIVPNSD